MPGNKNSGRLPTPTSVLKLTGQYREDRHGQRKRAPRATGKPVCPRWLKGESRRLWERIVPRLITLGVASDIDREQLAGMCQWWALWRQYDSKAQAGDRKFLSAARQAWMQFSSISAHFGMTPADRIKLAIGGEAEEADPTESRFFGGPTKAS